MLMFRCSGMNNSLLANRLKAEGRRREAEGGRRKADFGFPTDKL